MLKNEKSGDILLISELSRFYISFLGMDNDVSNLFQRVIHIKTLNRRLETTDMHGEITIL